jgi:hypothetical protein
MKANQTSQLTIHYSQFIINPPLCAFAPLREPSNDEKPGFFLSKHWLEIGQKPGFWGTA